MRTVVSSASLVVLVVLSVLLSCCPHVPLTADAAPSSSPVRTCPHGQNLADSNPDPRPKREKGGVDVWSICPPHMADVDCFYAYLRVYARLRKAAEESDRVTMRNIGKRSAMTFLSGLPRSKRRVMELQEMCPDAMPPAQCYRVARTLYSRLRAALLNAEYR